MSCRKYFEQDNCPCYPTDCYNCECSYSYTRTDEEIEEEEEKLKETKLNTEEF